MSSPPMQHSRHLLLLQDLRRSLKHQPRNDAHGHNGKLHRLMMYNNVLLPLPRLLCRHKYSNQEPSSTPRSRKPGVCGTHLDMSSCRQEYRHMSQTIHQDSRARGIQVCNHRLHACVHRAKTVHGFELKHELCRPLGCTLTRSQKT